MSDKTKIEWSDATWNPIMGCSMAKGSEAGGCLNCYAARFATRGLHRDRNNEPFAIMRPSGPRWTGEVEYLEGKLAVPLAWKRPRKIFVNSQSDLFHEDLPFEVIDRIFAMMALCPQHTFQVLTKRAARMRAWASRPYVAGDVQVHANDLRDRHKVRFAAVLKRQTLGANGRLRDPAELLEIIDCDPWPLPNVIMGVSVENQPTADDRIPELLVTPAAKRMVSYEPALGPVDFRTIRYDADYVGSALHGFPGPGGGAKLDWIIVGGESGPGARPFHLDWARGPRDQCKAGGVAFFFKQAGAVCMDGEIKTGAPGFGGHPDGIVPVRRMFRDKKGGDMSEWPPDIRVREFPK